MYVSETALQNPRVVCLDSRAAVVMTHTTNTVSLVTALTVNQSLCGVTFLTELVSGCMNLISIPCASAGSAGEFSIHGLFIYLICGTEANFCLSVFKFSSFLPNFNIKYRSTC